MAKVAEVWLWDVRVGAVLWDESQSPATGTFEYDPDFCEIGLQIAPITMPAVAGEVYAFPSLPEKAFKRLPPCLSDSLPDDFGNAVIDSWLASQGRDPKSFTPVERLLYVGARGMGALEYRPAALQAADKAEALQMSSLVELAGKILSDRKSQLDGLAIGPATGNEDPALQQLFKIGSSAGGAAPKRSSRSTRPPAKSAPARWMHHLATRTGCSSLTWATKRSPSVTRPASVVLSLPTT